MYATHWVVTLFAYNFPVTVLLRIWDHFFISGWKVFFKVCLAVLKMEEKILLKLDLEGVLEHLRGFPVSINCDKLFDMMYKIKVSQTELTNLEKKYNTIQKSKT